jgi:hypothetical protein
MPDHSAGHLDQNVPPLPGRQIEPVEPLDRDSRRRSGASADFGRLFRVVGPLDDF